VCAFVVIVHAARLARTDEPVNCLARDALDRPSCPFDRKSGLEKSRYLFNGDSGRITVAASRKPLARLEGLGVEVDLRAGESRRRGANCRQIG
jgi:hypothetical protein